MLSPSRVVDRDRSPRVGGAGLSESDDAIAPLVERANMLFRGTSAVRGSGEAVVVATGMATELGRIARMVEEAAEESTPLEKRLQSLGRILVYATIGIAALTAAVGILAGRDVFLMVEMGIALAVAAIPEGLPIVATIALARGMWRLARRNDGLGSGPLGDSSRT